MEGVWYCSDLNLNKQNQNNKQTKINNKNKQTKNPKQPARKTVMQNFVFDIFPCVTPFGVRLRGSKGLV